MTALAVKPSAAAARPAVLSVFSLSTTAAEKHAIPHASMQKESAARLFFIVDFVCLCTV